MMSFSTGSELSRAHALFQRLEREGASFVHELYISQKSEELFLDYKAIATNPGQSLNQTDFANLKKALSGFSNSEGGVIIWGIRTSKVAGVEKIEPPKGYEDARRFMSLIEGAISGCVIPPVPGVRSIVIKDNEDTANGFVATLIPASPHAPHQTADDQRAYYMRAGSSFQRVPHGILAGMFGRSPHPALNIRLIPEPFEWRKVSPLASRSEPQFPTLSLKIHLEITNESPTPAREGYVSWKFHGSSQKLPGYQVEAIVDESQWLYPSKGTRGACIAKDETKLIPFTGMKPVVFTIVLREPFENDFAIELIIGCMGAPAQRLSISTPKTVMHSIYSDFIKAHNEYTSVPLDKATDYAIEMAGIRY